MPKSEWTSATLPRVDIYLERDIDPQGARELYLARLHAHDALKRAEEAERDARSLRSAANLAVGHFQALLEEQVTEPLFEVERDET